MAAEVPSRRKTTTAPRSGFRPRGRGFVLRVDTMDVPVSKPRLIIGRSSSADIQFDGPAVSRQHAAIVVTERGLMLEDLASRNGVFVNGVLIGQPLPLEHGDRIRVGEHEIEVVMEAAPPVEPVVEPREDVSTARIDPLEVLGGIVEQALDTGDGEEAEALVSGHLRVLSKEARNGQTVRAETVGVATRFALRLAETTRNGAWVDYVLELHLFARRLVATTTIRELFRLASVVRYQDRTLLKRYLEFVASQGLALGSETPAVLERLSRYGRL